MAVVSIGVHVREYSGQVVARLNDPEDTNGLCAVAAADPDRYPYLDGVDEYGDTYFNSRQSVRLAQELEALARDDSEAGLQQTAQAVLRLVGMLQPVPGRPHHRQLVFSGD